MAKHNPAGEVCPHCPPGTPVGFCVRHLAGWDPEPALIKHAQVPQIDLSNFESFHDWALTVLWEESHQTKFHVRVCGGQSTDEAVCIGYNTDRITIRVPHNPAGLTDVRLAWGDVVELWPI